jgi:hypothetical protein
LPLKCEVLAFEFAKHFLSLSVIDHIRNLEIIINHHHRRRRRRRRRRRHQHHRRSRFTSAVSDLSTSAAGQIFIRSTTMQDYLPLHSD